MALSFPASPTVGQQYTDSNRTWEWNGQTWEAISSADFGTGSLTIPVSSTLPTGEGQIVFDGTTDTLHIGEGVGSVQIAKDADIPQTIVDLGIADGTAGQFLSTDGAGNFTFATPVDMVGANALDELTDVTAAGSTAGQVLTSDGAGNFTFTTLAGGGSETITSLAYDSGTQILTFTDEAGADTALDLSHLLDNTDTVYTDSDVAVFLNGDLNSNIVPLNNSTIDIGSSTRYIKETWTSVLRVGSVGYLGNVTISGDNITNSSNLTISAGTDLILQSGGGSSKIQVETDMVPDTSITHDLGKSTSRWNEVHAGEGFFDDITATTYTTASQMRFTSGSDFIFAGSRINGTAANTLDIGESTFPMKAIHTNNLTSYTTLTIPINNTPNTADGSMTWDGTNNKLYVGDGSTAIEIGAGGGGGSVALDDVTDVTAAGSTAGQMLTSDGAGAYTFTTPYGDSDVTTLAGQFPSNIVPNATNSRDLGGVSNYWNQIFGNNVTFNTLNVNTSVNTNLIPNTNITHDLGSSGAKWDRLWVNNLNMSGSATFSIPVNPTAQIADGAMTWNGTTNKLYIGDGTSAIEIGTSYSDTDVRSYLNGNLDTHIVPDTNATFDIGTAEKKIRHLFLSDNSIKFVNAADVEFSMGVDGDNELTFNGTKVDDSAIAKIKSADLDMGGNRVLFANVYTDLADLPDAGAYHGMFAHVHNEAASYYAHASAWHKLANDADVPAAITDLGITDGTSGQVLTTDGAGNFTFTTVSGGGGGATTLDGLTDVTAAGSTAGQILVSDGAGNYTFQNATLTSIIDILDVSDGTVGQILQKTGASSYQFTNFTLNELSDVNATSTAGQVLTSDGAGNFTFATPAGGGGGATTLDGLTDVTAAGSANGEVLTSDGAGAFTFQAVTAQLGRNQYAGTTASLADQASGDLDVTGCKTYTLFKISTDVAAWVVLYTDAASRTADTRTYADKGSDPSTDGVIAEVITTGAETVIVSPGVIGFNNEGTPTSNMPMKVFNDSGGAATVTVTVDVLTLEV